MHFSKMRLQIVADNQIDLVFQWSQILSIERSELTAVASYCSCAGISTTGFQPASSGNAINHDPGEIIYSIRSPWCFTKRSKERKAAYKNESIGKPKD